MNQLTSQGFCCECTHQPPMLAWVMVRLITCNLPGTQAAPHVRPLCSLPGMGSEGSFPVLAEGVGTARGAPTSR